MIANRQRVYKESFAGPTLEGASWQANTKQDLDPTFFNLVTDFH